MFGQICTSLIVDYSTAQEFNLIVIHGNRIDAPFGRWMSVYKSMQSNLKSNKYLYRLWNKVQRKIPFVRLHQRNGNQDRSQLSRSIQCQTPGSFGTAWIQTITFSNHHAPKYNLAMNAPLRLRFSPCSLSCKLRDGSTDGPLCHGLGCTASDERSLLPIVQHWLDLLLWCWRRRLHLKSGLK
jgi:hypothetical protein